MLCCSATTFHDLPFSVHPVTLQLSIRHGDEVVLVDVRGILDAYEYLDRVTNHTMEDGTTIPLPLRPDGKAFRKQPLYRHPLKLHSSSVVEDAMEEKNARDGVQDAFQRVHYSPYSPPPYHRGLPTPLPSHLVPLVDDEDDYAPPPRLSCTPPKDAVRPTPYLAALTETA